MTTSEKWASRVQGWRASGQSARAYSAGQGFSGGTLLWWSSRLGANIEGNAKFARVVVRGSEDVAGAVVAAGETPIMIEIGAVRLGVRRGFDRDALREVLALVGGTR
jgi:hypothetical protein